MPMVSLKLMAGAARSMVVASARTENDGCLNSDTPYDIASRWCARKVRGEDRERPYRVESWVVCVPAPQPVRKHRKHRGTAGVE